MTRIFFCYIAAITLFISAGGNARSSDVTSQDALGTLHGCSVDGVRGPVRCADYTVAEDRSRVRGRTLSLKLILLTAKDATSAGAPVFYFTGGPGEAATDAAAALSEGWEREHHDVVLVDLRGSAKAGGLDCALGGNDDDMQSYLAPLFDAAADYSRCRDELLRRADLVHYTTADFVADIDEIRAALGYDKINIEAGSYGTRLAIAYIHRHGEHVRSALLAGVVPMQNRSPLYHAQAAQRAIDLVFSECRAERACRRRFPHPAADLAAILQRLRSASATTSIVNPLNGQRLEVLLDAAAFADGLRLMLYSTDQGRRIPLLLHRARAGDFAPFAQTALTANRSLKQSIRLGLLISASCAEDVRRIRAEELKAETAHRFIGDERIRGQMAACSIWPGRALPNDYYEEFQSSVPVVLYSGNLDPVTPPAWGEIAKRTFKHSVHVIGPGAHVEMNHCIDSIGDALFRDASIERLDLTCVAHLENPPFATE